MGMYNNKFKAYRLLDSIDLSFPTIEIEKAKHKMKRLIPTPNSVFIGSECTVCKKANLIFSHSSKQRKCKFCFSVLTKPKGGKCLPTQNCLIIRKFNIIW